MADDKPDLESLKRRRSHAQRNFTTRINRLDVSAGRLREVELSEELARLKDDYDKLLDVGNEYIDAQSQIDPTGDDSESRDALEKRDASEQRFLETEGKIMEMMWSKYAAPDIDALVTQFKSAFDQAEALGKSIVVPWTQRGVYNGKLDRKLDELREAVYAWRDYRPHGKDKWMLLLSLKEDKEQLMDEWTCQRDKEVMKRNCTEQSDGAVGRHVATASDSLTAAGNITFTQQTLQPTLQSRRSDGGLGVSSALPPTLASTPQLLSVRASPPVDISMEQGSSMPYSGPGAYVVGNISSQWARPNIRLTPISLPKFSRDRRDYWR